MTTTIYAIASKCFETYGQGDFGEELKICQKDAYHQDGTFPPVFRSEHSAREHLEKMNYYQDKIIVKLKLRD